MADYALSRTYLSVVIDYPGEGDSKRTGFEESCSDMSLNRSNSFPFASKLGLNKGQEVTIDNYPNLPDRFSKLNQL